MTSSDGGDRWTDSLDAVLVPLEHRPQTRARLERALTGRGVVGAACRPQAALSDRTAAGQLPRPAY